jgi:hypothetical protein
MSRRRRTQHSGPPSERLGALVGQALDVAKKARRNRKSLSGDNFYGNKLAALRADATNAFRQLASRSAGDASALAELLQMIFAANVPQSKRLQAARELAFALRTTWKPADPVHATGDAVGEDLFPLTIVSQTNRGYLLTVTRQMNGCFHQGWYDASAVMMRRLLEICIIEAFEAKGISPKIKDGSGNYLHLSDLIDRALQEPSWTLSRNAKRYLPQLRDVGHQSAHGRFFHARLEDIERVRPGCRVVIEEFLYHASLL